jgi:hypothetical protein
MSINRNPSIIIRGNRHDGFMLFLARDGMQDTYLGWYAEVRDADNAYDIMTNLLQTLEK